MKVKVIGGNLLYNGKVYGIGNCLEIQDTEYSALNRFVKECDCGCGGHNQIETQAMTVKPKKGKKKGCKTC